MVFCDVCAAGCRRHDEVLELAVPSHLGAVFSRSNLYVASVPERSPHRDVLGPLRSLVLKRPAAGVSKTSGAGAAHAHTTAENPHDNMITFFKNSPYRHFSEQLVKWAKRRMSLDRESGSWNIRRTTAPHRNAPCQWAFVIPQNADMATAYSAVRITILIFFIHFPINIPNPSLRNPDQPLPKERIEYLVFLFVTIQYPPLNKCS